MTEPSGKSERKNPFKPIYDICNSGGSNHKLVNLPDFPRYMDVELTNHCNFRCLMCWTGTGASRRPKGFMSEQTWQKLLDEIQEHKTPLRFIRWGEPTLHPKYLDFIGQAKRLGITGHLTTNGYLLKESALEQLVELPLDSIKFSLQGIDAATYRQMRNIDGFDQVLENVRRLFRLRGEGLRPYIHVSTSITHETREQVEEFRLAVAKYCDLVSVGRTKLEHIDLDRTRLSEEEKERWRILMDQQTIARRHFECIEIFDKLSINWDGSVSACCGDYDNLMLVGHLENESLKDIWRGPTISYYRRMLADWRHDDLPLCRTCYDVTGELKNLVPVSRPSVEASAPVRP
ncbi:MAG: radical SAM protein [Thermodesulfobacteriota bacterium]